jgi:Zn-dependent protease with chaperone function
MPWPTRSGWTLSADTTGTPLRVRWFDGLSSQPREALLILQAGPRGPSLHLHPLEPGAQALRLQHHEVGWPEAWSAHRAPRAVTVDLGSHGSVQIDDVAAWNAALRAAGQRPALAQRMQTRWPAFLAVLLVAAAALGAFYRWGTPWAATQITRQVPLDWETGLTARALADLDKSYLQPSKLPAQRQAQIRQQFDALVAQLDPGMRRYKAYAPTWTLLFRSGMGANAFALPGGTIVVTDGLVQQAQRQGLGDEAIAGVLAHEIGHVAHRHTTRMVVEQGVLNIGLGLALGDVSSLLSIGASMLTGLAYRRNHETEADCFAVALMRKAQQPTAPMADLLLGMEGERGGEAAKKEATTSGGGIANLLSSHPQTAERALKLKEGRVEGC